MIERLIEDIIYGELFSEDGKSSRKTLHPSSDLQGCLRSTQLRIADAPRVPASFGSRARAFSGTLWHMWFSSALEHHGISVMKEVSLKDGLPRRWSGTADTIFFNKETKKFRIGDLKTVEGSGLEFVAGKIKPEHHWQASSYHYAAEELGLQMDDVITIAYLPISNDFRSPISINPVFQSVKPLPKELVWDRMETIRASVEAYEIDLAAPGAGIINHGLDSGLDRQQKLVPIKSKGIVEVKLVPHWLATYCPYPSPYCVCKNAGVTKIGHYDNKGVYYPRAGFDSIKPTVRPL